MTTATHSTRYEVGQKVEAIYNGVRFTGTIQKINPTSYDICPRQGTYWTSAERLNDTLPVPRTNSKYYSSTRRVIGPA